MSKHTITKTVIGTVIGHYIYDHRESIGKTLSAVGEAVGKAIEKAIIAQQLEKLKAMDFIKDGTPGIFGEADCSCGEADCDCEKPTEGSFMDFLAQLAAQGE